jgi:RNA polymerase sigma-70 factor, ECF subfamily
LVSRHTSPPSRCTNHSFEGQRDSPERTSRMDTLVSSAISSTWLAADEEALLRQEGEEGLAEIFVRYHDRLARMVAFRLDPRLVGRVDPEDVLQEAYLEAARRLQHILADPAVSLFVRIRQITWQTLLTVHRRHLGQKRNAGAEVAFLGRASDQDGSHALAERLAGHWTSPSQAAMRDERWSILREAIAKMDDLDREVLALRHFEQLDNAEVADVLGLSKTAASNRYVRALRRLKTYLDSATSLGDDLA